MYIDNINILSNKYSTKSKMLLNKGSYKIMEEKLCKRNR
jgi:hypothetical protein